VDGSAVLKRAGTRLPSEPGVYRFRDSLDRVIYLGRATDLRSRVRSYAGDLGRRAHLRRMVPQIRTVEAIVCASVPEAAWLERNLLERSMPRWNRIRGGMELVGWLVVSDDPARPALDLVVEGANVPEAAFGPYLGVDRLARSMAEVRGVTPGDLTLYANRVRAVLARDEPATAELHALLEAASGRAVEQLAFETALQIQAEAAALDWLVAPQRVTGCSPGLVVAARADGVEFSLAASGTRLDRWTTGRTSATGVQPSEHTPADWCAFATRNAELTALLARPS